LPPAEVIRQAAWAATALLAAWHLRRQLAGLIKRGNRMPGFNAATVVEALDWKFDSCDGKHDGDCWRGPSSGDRPSQCTVFVPGAHCVVSEPNDDQITEYMTALKKLTADIRARVPTVGEDSDPVDLMTAIDDLEPEIIKEMTSRMADICSDLCSGSPSTEQMMMLPPRRRTMFYGWLQQEVLSPEAVPGGGNAQVRTLRSAAAG
jgi:hypothetical protein